ncbi:eosinophil peroxidase-like [Clarias gariepinus]
MNLLRFVVVLGLCYTLSYPPVSGSEEEGLSRSFILDAIDEAKRLVDNTYLYSRQVSLERVRRAEFTRPADIQQIMKQPRRKARDAVRAADYMEQTLRIISERSHHAHKRSINATALLTPEQIHLIENLTGCQAQTHPPSCRTTQNLNKYRTASSVCNNLYNPLQGASNTPFSRWLPPIYEDGISQPKGWNQGRLYNGFPLPLVREVSNRIFATQNKDVVGDSQYTFFLTFFGQFTDHDLTLTPLTPSIRSFSNGIDCDVSCARAEPCFPIELPANDPRRSSLRKGCLPFFRSAPVCASGENAYLFGGVPQIRLQINSLTSYIDLGTVYGSEDGQARELRDLSSDEGLLRANPKFGDNGRELLPFSTVDSDMCTTHNRYLNTTGKPEVPCFDAGDNRVSENPGLTVLHTMFFREHNRVARALRRINPHWSGEQVYQEARKIMGAFQQVMVFRDYLPHIVGTDAATRLLGDYPGYDSNVDPTISSVFSTAANRFAHATLQPYIFRVNEQYKPDSKYPTFPLHLGFFAPFRVVYEGGIDPLVRGLLSHPAKLNKQHAVLVNEVREKLFDFTNKIAQDLGSLNLQRSRDHALPGYNTWRKFCGLSTPKNLKELAKVLNSTSVASSLLNLYGSPDNIDIWAGGISEPFVRGGRVGPLFSCIIATQFHKIRQGDRFWWENDGIFTPQQKEQLTKISLSRIICDNTALTKVPRDAFLLSRNQANFVNCNAIPEVDLSPWKQTDLGDWVSSEESY